MNSRLLENLKIKKKLLEASDPKHEEIRPLLLVLAGGMKGINGIGALSALHSLGFTSVFDTVVVISTGAICGNYFVTGQIEIAESIYLDNFTSSNFINTGIWNYMTGGKVIDLDYVMSLVAQGQKGLRLDVLNNSRSNTFIGVTHFPDGQGSFLGIKESPHPFRVIEASMTIPILCGPPVIIGRDSYVDGMIAYPFPVLEVFEKFHPTDILVITNSHSKRENMSFSEKIMDNNLVQKYPPNIRQLASTREERFEQSLKSISSLNSVNVEVLWAPDDSVTFLTQDRSKLRNALISSRQMCMDLFK